MRAHMRTRWSVFVLVGGALVLAACQSSVDREFQNRPVSEWPSQQAIRSLGND